MNLRAARIVSEQESCRQKWMARSTRRWTNKTTQTARQSIINATHSRNIYSRKWTYPLHELHANTRVVVTMNCARHTTMNQQNNPKTTIINNSCDTFKKHLFAKMNLLAAQHVCKQVSCRHNEMRTSHDEIQWTNNSLKSIRAQVPRNLRTAQSNAEFRCHKHNPNNNQLRISSIFFKVNAFFFVLTSYDCEEFAHKQKLSNNSKQRGCYRWFRPSVLHAVYWMPNSKHRCVITSVYHQIELLWLNSYKLSKK